MCRHEIYESQPMLVEDPGVGCRRTELGFLPGAGGERDRLLEFQRDREASCGRGQNS